jgi:hypothetical protein
MTTNVLNNLTAGLTKRFSDLNLRMEQETDNFQIFYNGDISYGPELLVATISETAPGVWSINNLEGQGATALAASLYVLEMFAIGQFEFQHNGQTYRGNPPASEFSNFPVPTDKLVQWAAQFKEWGSVLPQIGDVAVPVLPSVTVLTSA